MKEIILLENLTGKKVILKEEEVTRQIKKQFYGVTADFERESKRLINFFDKNVPLHPDLKSLSTRIKRSLQGIENTFEATEQYLDSGKGLKYTDNQPEITFPEVAVPIDAVKALTEEMGMTTAAIAVPSMPITSNKKK